MQTNSNSTVSSEIDAIIARAMEEYSRAKGIDVFVNDDVRSVDTPEEVTTESTHQEIPVNSDSVLVEETTSRFSSALWFENVKSKNVTLAGLGGIGSYVGFLLSRLHVHRLTIYDDDRVEAGNMSGQLYCKDDVGHTKVDALATTMQDYSDYYDVIGMNERFVHNSGTDKIMMCGFDNMVARETAYSVWRDMVNALPNEEKGKCLFIDGRLAAESLQVLCIKGDDEFSKERYERDFLFSDREAEETVCSYKQTSFMANMIASIMVNLFVNFCANECSPLIPRDLPFFTEYTAETMFFKIVA